MDLTEFREPVRKAVEQYLIDNWITETPIAFEDNQFDPAKKAPEGKWIRTTILYGEPIPGEKGENGLSIQPGVIKINVFTPIGGGHSDSNILLGKLDRLFRFKTLGNGIIETGDPYSIPSPDKKEKIYFMETLTVPFHTYKGQI